MANRMSLEINEKAARRALKNVEKNEGRELFGLIERAYKPNPDQKDIEALQNWLDENPEIWRLVFDMSHVIEANLILRIIPNRPAQLALEKNVENIRSGMGYEHATALEASLIDNVVLSWLRWQWAEYQLVLVIGGSELGISMIEFWERRLTSSQSRYLRACETLAKVRKLMARNPAFQVNIASEGGQQVNIGGDVVKPGSTFE